MLQEAEERQVCSQQLLPTLVAASPAAEAAQRIAGMVEGLLRPAGEGASHEKPTHAEEEHAIRGPARKCGAATVAQIREALNLATAFSSLLLDHWQLHSLSGNHNAVAHSLIARGLQFGLKECGSLRKQARFLLESAVQKALSDASASKEFQSVANLSLQSVSAAWRNYWELFDTLEDYSSHLLKSSWQALITRLMSFLARLRDSNIIGSSLPPVIPSPGWLEVFLVRALDHDNDSVQKFALGQLMCLDQRAACLSESFILEEILPRFSHSIDSLYPKHDVEQTFEGQVSAFFTGFVQRHEDGSAAAARRLLQTVLEIRAIHFTPLRLILSTLLNIEICSDAPALEAEQALELAEKFFTTEVLLRMPISTRQRLSMLFLDVVARLGQAPSTATKLDHGDVQAHVARVAAAATLVPDSLLAQLRKPLGLFAQICLGTEPGEAAAQAASLLKSLAQPTRDNSAYANTWAAMTIGGESHQHISPMQSAKLTLGSIRLIWSLQAEHPGHTSEEWFEELVWPVLAPSLQDLSRRSYLPRKAAVAALFGCTYAMGLLSNPKIPSDARIEMLGYVQAKAALSLGFGQADEVVQEAPWVWLYAKVLENFGESRSTFVKDVLDRTRQVIVQESDGGANAVLTSVAAASFLGALAPKLEATSERCELFLLLWRAHAPGRPNGCRDSRFGIGISEDMGTWRRNRIEEYEDLHRVDREGLGRVLEWRDASPVFLVAKWRAMAVVARYSVFLADLSLHLTSTAAGAADASKADGLLTLGRDLLAELDTLQPPQVAYWAVVARHIAYPAFFGMDGMSARHTAEEQREALLTLCKGLRGSISQSVGDGSVFMPRGCMLELAAALCDPVLRTAELRLFAGEMPGPLSTAVKELLNLGELGTNVSRTVAVPLLATLLAEQQSPSANNSDVTSSASELLTSLLIHSEYVIQDGALSHSLYPCSGALDTSGPGGASALDSVSVNAEQVCGKFNGTPGLPRILTLAALDGLAQRAAKQEADTFPSLLVAVLERLLALLRKELETLLKRPGGNKSGGSKPVTPMPLSPLHRLQLRGWQAVLILGSHANKAAAEFLISELFWHLKIPHLPDVRDYQELLGCLLCSRFPDFAVQPMLVPALSAYDVPPQVSASLLVICSFLFRDLAAEVSAPERRKLPTWASSLVSAVAPYLGHNSAYVRGMGSWGFFEFMNAVKGAGALEELSTSDELGREFLNLISDLHGFLESNKECGKMRRRLYRVFQDFEVGSKTVLEALTKLSEVLPRDGLPGQNNPALLQPLHIFADSDFRPSQTFLTFLKDEVAQEIDTMYQGDHDATQYSSFSEHWQEAQLAVLRGNSVANEPAESEETPQESGAAGGASGLQRKFVPPAPPCPPEGCSGSNRSAATAELLARSRQPLVVIASLVDKIPNLAGLCRTCEVFHCEALCLPNLKVASEQAFQSISVTAEKWLPLKGIARGAPLKSQLLELRRRGYALVGVEQTHTSVPLDNWKFGERTAILLGAEKEGIDAELLPLLDACVEIPQQGQLRSLNVHVSGSVVIWEYVRQARNRACGSS